MGPIRAFLALVACAASAPAQDNVLVLLADDLGIDQLAAYGLGADTPPTPNLDALAAGGVLFRNAYASPVCSPSRAQLLTGRHGFRNGITHIVGPGMVSPELYQLPLDETTIPEMLDLGTGGLYAHAAIGKWHLFAGAVGFATAPNDAGFAQFSGTPANLGLDPSGYYNWLKVEDGAFFVVLDTYATTDQVDEALAFLTSAPEPWFCYVAFSAVHPPYHAPPAALHTQDLSGAGPPAENPRPYYRAAVEALDTEIGRLLGGIAAALPRTNVFFASDNGTPFEVVVPPFNPSHAKATLYEGGVHVPLIASGPAVGRPGAACDALVCLTDLYATVAEIAGVDLREVQPPGFRLDSISLVPYLADPTAPSQRETVFARVAAPLGSAPFNIEATMVRDARYKLIRVGTPLAPGYPSAFYDLLQDPFELFDLLQGALTPAQLDAYRRLDTEARALMRPGAVAGPQGGETHVRIGANAASAGGPSSSESFRATSQLGLPAGGFVASTTRASRGGASFTSGGLASAAPVIFGFDAPRGASSGLETRRLFGFALDRLNMSALLQLELGGLPLIDVTVAGPTYAEVTTPAGLGQHGNPAGAQALWLHSDAGQAFQTRAFAYWPAIDLLRPARLGDYFDLRVATAQDALFQLLWGHASPGIALPVPPLKGKLELTAPKTLGPQGISAGGEVVLHWLLPEVLSLVGVQLDLQAVTLPLVDPAAGGFTNVQSVTLLPPW